MEHGFIELLIEEQKELHGVIDEINAEGICKHVHRGNLTVSCHGVISPVAEAEEYLVQVAIQMCKSDSLSTVWTPLH